MNFVTLTFTMPFISRTSIFAILAVSLLAACGGGGSSSTGPTATTPTPTTTTPTPTPVATDITFFGRPSKGLLKNARIFVFESNSILTDDILTVAETRTSAETGEYSLTIDTNDFTNLGDYLVIAAVLNEATLLCDSPIGCSESVAFGEDYIVPAATDSTEVLPMYAIVPKPVGGTTVLVNPNIFSQMAFQYFDLLASQRPVVSFNEQDIVAGEARIATLFGLQEGAYHALPFVDVTKTVTNSDSNAIRAALIAGGVQSELSRFRRIGNSAEDGFESGYVSFQRDFGRNEGDLRGYEAYEGEDGGRTEVGLQDIYRFAEEIEILNPTTNNAFSVAVQSIRDSYADVLSSQAYSLTSGGELTPPIPNVAPIFFGTGFQARDGDAELDISSEVFDENGPNEVITFTLNESVDSDFFTLTEPGLLIPNEPFDCTDPKDADGDQVYQLNITISDGEFDVTQDMTLSIFTRDGNFCSNTGVGKPTLVPTNAPVEVNHSIAGRLAEVLWQ